MVLHRSLNQGAKKPWKSLWMCLSHTEAECKHRYLAPNKTWSIFYRYSLNSSLFLNSSLNSSLSSLNSSSQWTSVLLCWTLLTKIHEKKWCARFHNWPIQCNQSSIYQSELFWQMWNVFREATIFTVQLGNHCVKAMPALHKNMWPLLL